MYHVSENNIYSIIYLHSFLFIFLDAATQLFAFIWDQHKMLLLTPAHTPNCEGGFFSIWVKISELYFEFSMIYHSSHLLLHDNTMYALWPQEIFAM